MSYSLILARNNYAGDLLSFYRSLVMNSEFDLYGELKCFYYIGRKFKQYMLYQAAYKYDEIYNSHFFESMSKEEFEAIPKEFVTKQFRGFFPKLTNEIDNNRINNEDQIINVDQDKEHILLPLGDLIVIEYVDSLPSVFQNFYKFKKTDLEPLYYSPDRMDSNPELVAAKERFNALQIRNQLGINEDNRVGGNRRKINKKIKTNKKRKQRMRKTKHKW
jgi:hypothetical protein